MDSDSQSNHQTLFSCKFSPESIRSLSREVTEVPLTPKSYNPRSQANRKPFINNLFQISTQHRKCSPKMLRSCPNGKVVIPDVTFNLWIRPLTSSWNLQHVLDIFVILIETILNSEAVFVSFIDIKG